MTKASLISSIPISPIPLKEGMQGTDGMVSKTHHSLLSIPGQFRTLGNAWERLGMHGLKPPSMARKGGPEMNWTDDYLDAIDVYTETAERMGEDYPQTKMALDRVMALAPTRHWGALTSEEQSYD
jgi:hypothetical protein